VSQYIPSVPHPIHLVVGSAGAAEITHATSGLAIQVRASNASALTSYSAASSEIETITTLGTWAEPTAGKVRFKRATDNLYEIHLPAATFAISGAQKLHVRVNNNGTYSDWLQVELNGNVTHVTGTAPTKTGGILDVHAKTIQDDAITQDAVANDALDAGKFGSSYWTMLKDSDHILLVKTTIATLASQTSFTLSAGSADPNAYRNAIAIFTDSVTSTQKSFCPILEYDGDAKRITLARAPAFTIAPGDSVSLVVTGEAQQGAGTGSVAYTYGPVLDDEGNPLENATIWATNSTAATPRIAEALTSATGYVTLFLDPGAYYFWGSKNGHSFNNPDGPITVS